MMEDKIIVYRTFENPMEANVVMLRIKDAGFDCFLTGENAALIYPVFDNSISGVQLHVFESEVGEIDKLLADEPALGE